MTKFCLPLILAITITILAKEIVGCCHDDCPKDEKCDCVSSHSGECKDKTPTTESTTEPTTVTTTEETTTWPSTLMEEVVTSVETTTWLPTTLLEEVLMAVETTTLPEPTGSTVDEFKDDNRVKCKPCEARRKALKDLYDKYYPQPGNPGAGADVPSSRENLTATTPSSAHEDGAAGSAPVAGSGESGGDDGSDNAGVDQFAVSGKRKNLNFQVGYIKSNSAYSRRRPTEKDLKFAEQRISLPNTTGGTRLAVNGASKTGTGLQVPTGSPNSVRPVSPGEQTTYTYRSYSTKSTVAVTNYNRGTGHSEMPSTSAAFAKEQQAKSQTTLYKNPAFAPSTSVPDPESLQQRNPSLPLNPIVVHPKNPELMNNASQVASVSRSITQVRAPNPAYRGLMDYQKRFEQIKQVRVFNTLESAQQKKETAATMEQPYPGIHLDTDSITDVQIVNHASKQEWLDQEVPNKANQTPLAIGVHKSVDALRRDSVNLSPRPNSVNKEPRAVSQDNLSEASFVVVHNTLKVAWEKDIYRRKIAEASWQQENNTQTAQRQEDHLSQSSSSLDSLVDAELEKLQNGHVGGSGPKKVRKKKRVKDKNDNVWWMEAEEIERLSMG
ncbi:hypothetical protein Ddc_11245 [Ditylenchus destructor]|nr:hypothetical protein Ddc_11245 [Ditylenchus destructor]